jgi:hypothetical protein
VLGKWRSQLIIVDAGMGGLGAVTGLAAGSVWMPLAVSGGCLLHVAGATVRGGSCCSLLQSLKSSSHICV